MKNPIETPKISPSKHPFVTRIYTTKGRAAESFHNTHDHKGTFDKRAGVVINDKIHWIDREFSSIDDLEHLLMPREETTSDLFGEPKTVFKRTFPLHIGIDRRGLFRNLRESATYLDKKITKIGAHFEALPQNYMDRTLPHSAEKLSWSIEELHDKYYS